MNLANFQPQLAQTLRIPLELFWLSLLVSGCALPDSANSVTSACNIPADQAGTIGGHWLARPIPVAFSPGSFSQSEITAMTAAADTWNRFFNSSKNSPIFDYGGDPKTIRATSGANPGSGVCSRNPVFSNGQFNGSVGIYKVAPWPYSSSFIALTSFCTVAGTTASTDGQTYKAMTSAVMEVNYASFFVSGKPQPDLQSVILHEFGHLLGLDHSCGQKPNMPACESNLNPDYQNAVMFPTFYFTNGYGAAKQALQINDQSRANCLY
jgi:hypothetical protein